MDDRALIRSGLRALLQEHPDIHVIGEAATTEDALRLALASAPDIVVVDASAHTIDAVETTRLLVTRCAAPRPRVLIVINALGDDSGHEAIRAGASGLLLNHADPRELVAALRMVAAGYLLLVASDPGPKKAAGLPEPPEVKYVAAELESLTQRELDVLALAARGHTNAEISAALCLSESTVKSHIQHMLEKLRLRNRVHAVIYAYEAGLVKIGTASLDHLQRAY
ncbi:LuxR C-terminal-related transcriptional regulator [Actinomadura chokoriensis]|uniref:Response regulator transcription factor n=1 Tax=Actinomadura chokoriensis TaxID=454156 RepID=A0ABV4R3J6_9ACTN